VIHAFDPARLRSVVGVAVPVGFLAGLASALLQTFTGEPLVRKAIAIEQARNAAASAPGQAGAPELISRSVQSGVGLFAALAVSGATFGLVFALAFWGLRAGRPDPFLRALVAGTILFGSLTLAPWLKYPPNPPSVGDPDTLDRRQALYVSAVALALALALVGAALSSRLRRWPPHLRFTTVGLAVAVPFALALALLPPAPDPVAAPATLIWRFRLASLGGNALLWAVLTVGFGLLAAEATRRRQRPPTEA